MDFSSKQDVEIEMKFPADDFYNLLKGKIQHLSTISSDQKKTISSDKSLTFTALEGDLLAHYKSYKATVKITPKPEGCLVKVTVDYEKLNEDVPAPDKYLDFVVNVVKDIDAHIIKP
ncbi:MLP-like protein 28 [Corylus avellana]|uniref:MLP-like protein 28 n=1 Tax=Corylus avellana TaxID=13451 RepID=UPI00286CE740|nr:MLP-like protein 28 [Corylus avellana]